MRLAAFASALFALSACADLEVSSREQYNTCGTTLSTSATGTTVALDLSNGLNAWKTHPPDVAISGAVTTCTGPAVFSDSSLDGTWTDTTGACSTAWTGSLDLSAAANHWHNLIHCDNSVEVVGCQGDASFTLTASLDGNGANDFSDTATGTIAAVQDPDEYEQCGGECDIGACVSACQADCPQGDTECGQCCECWCKDEGLQAGNAACQPQALCYSGSSGHAVCLSGSQP